MRRVALPDYATLVARLISGEGLAVTCSELEERLLSATLALLSHTDERHITADDIAAEARVGRGSIFRCFGSKDALIALVYERELGRAVARVRAAAAGASDPASALAAAFSELQEITVRHALVRRLASAAPDRLVELCRSGEPSGLRLISALLKSLAHEHAGETRIDSSGLDAAVEILTELHFAGLFVEHSPSTSRERAEVVSATTALSVSSDPRRSPRRRRS
jgi:AcrR family transcriptional regulator